MPQASHAPAQVPPSHPCWAHINQIFPEDRADLLEATANALEQIKAALLSDGPLERSSLVLLCDHALIDVRAADELLANAITLMNGIDPEVN